MGIMVIRNHRIHIHGAFVCRFAKDEWQTIKQIVKLAKEANLNSPRFLIPAPLPGMRFRERAVSENRVRLNDWTLYAVYYAVLRPARISIFIFDVQNS
jgi:hypothetical protein